MAVCVKYGFDFLLGSLLTATLKWLMPAIQSLPPCSHEQSYGSWVATKRQHSLKPGFHYPSWQVTVSITRQHGSSTRLVLTGSCWRVMETGHPSTRAVNLGSGNQAWLWQLRTETSMIGVICGLHSKTERKLQSGVNCWYWNIRTSSVLKLQYTNKQTTTCNN